jgi:uncharacterized iron-regulated membrane protein
MTARRILFWVHLTAGAMAGLVILVMSVTGVLLAYKRQIIRWADGSFQSHPVPGARPLPMEEVLARVQASRGRMPSGITLRPGARDALAFDLGRESTVFVDRFTGQELGEESPKLRGFFSGLEDLHRWLGASTANRRYGRAITGACNLSFLVLVTTGPFLWWPREWTLAALKKIAVLRPGPWNRARDWNWHNTLGSWCAAPLFLVVVTGVIMSYPWANNLLYRLTGNASPPPPSVAAAKGRPDRESQKGTGHDSRLDGLENLFARAERQVPGWTTISVRLAGAPSDQLTFSIDRGNGGRPDLRSQLTLDTASGAVTSMEDFSSYNRGRRWRLWARFTHTGEAFGAMGQTIAGIASLAASLLVFTGLSLALRRLAGWTERRTLKRRTLKSEEAESSRIAV